VRLLPRVLVATVTAAGLVASTAVLATPANAVDVPSPSPSQASNPAAPSAPVIKAVKAGVVSGQLVVTYRPPATDGGSAITGYEVSVDATTWWPCVGTAGKCTLMNLTNGTTYSVSLRAVNAAGAGAPSSPKSGVPIVPAPYDPTKPKKLPKPRSWVNASFDAAGNIDGVDGKGVRLGVAVLPQLRFTKSIPDKAVVESHLKVTALRQDGRVKKVKGAWGWLDDRTVMFRPAKYWPGRSTISITSTLDRAVMGKSGGKYVVGTRALDTTYTFRTARKLIAKVDGKKVNMRVWRDGKKIKTFGVSLGKSEWETRNGVKVIGMRKEASHTYLSTSLGLGPEEEYELVAPWNTRLTPTGEFIHTARWAYGRIGYYNGSHGCTNMREEDAKWIYDKTIPGDVVLYENTGGETVQSWNGPGGLWNIPWEKWLKKSALGNNSGTVDTSNVTTGSDSQVVDG
jgi:lipoprotein-anchoring transpeptidase ErfK/SrfK